MATKSANEPRDAVRARPRAGVPGRRPGRELVEGPHAYRNPGDAPALVDLPMACAGAVA